MSTTKEVLTRAKALISTPENWAYGDLATTTTGTVVPIHDSAACCFCALGAIARAYSQDAPWFIQQFQSALSYEEKFEGVPGINELAKSMEPLDECYRLIHRPAVEKIWCQNDNLAVEKKHDVLMSLFDKAIEAAADPA